MASGFVNPLRLFHLLSTKVLVPLVFQVISNHFRAEQEFDQWFNNFFIKLFLFSFQVYLYNFIGIIPGNSPFIQNWCKSKDPYYFNYSHFPIPVLKCWTILAAFMNQLIAFLLLNLQMVSLFQYYFRILACKKLFLLETTR